jgi:hypothetical protein
MQPVGVQSIMAAAMAGGGVVFFGTLYAIFYALGRNGANRRFIGDVASSNQMPDHCKVYASNTVHDSNLSDADIEAFAAFFASRKGCP